MAIVASATVRPMSVVAKPNSAERHVLVLLHLAGTHGINSVTAVDAILCGQHFIGVQLHHVTDFVLQFIAVFTDSAIQFLIVLCRAVAYHSRAVILGCEESLEKQARNWTVKVEEGEQRIPHLLRDTLESPNLIVSI